MKGQVFTVAKLHYINGVVYQTANEGTTTLQTLANNYKETTKSGKVKHPLVRVRTLARLAKGLGLIDISKKGKVKITDLGRDYFNARGSNKWSLSISQKKILGGYILSDYYRTETIYSITILFELIKNGYTKKELANQFAIGIGKDKAWKSEVTYDGFTNFGINYIDELGLMDYDDKDLLIKRYSDENKYQEKVNEVKSIQMPKGKLPKPKPKKQGKSEKYFSNPRRSKNAIETANFKCKLNQNHATFINKISKKQYMEAHHLIPISKQDYFDYDIDVPENILCFCPNCHRKIHLSENITKEEILKKVYYKRQKKLTQRGIILDFNALLNFYRISK